MEKIYYFNNKEINQSEAIIELSHLINHFAYDVKCFQDKNRLPQGSCDTLITQMSSLLKGAALIFDKDFPINEIDAHVIQNANFFSQL